MCSEALHNAKKITLETTFSPSVASVGDSDRLPPVVWNILSNAVKFTLPTRGVTLTLTGGLQPFRRADEDMTRVQNGLGSGLPIARQLAELSGGSIHAAAQASIVARRFTMRIR